MDCKHKKLCPVHVDERGELWDLLNEQVGHVGLIKSKKGSVRGNHYFKKSKRNAFVLSGSFELALALAESPDKVETKIIKEGDFVEIPPGVVHTFTALEDSTLLGMDTLSRSDEGYENDVVRIKIR